jgi:Capsule assembly protein Wzi
MLKVVQFVSLWLSLAVLALAQGSDRSVPTPDSGALYVPLDSWVYGGFDRLSGLGYLPTSISGMRPWTRSECVRLLREAGTLIAADRSSSESARLLYDALADELSGAAARRSNIALDSFYFRSLAVAGSPLRDGYHFAQTLVNDYGRPWAEGGNFVTGVSFRANAGPFALYTRGEFQRWPSSAPETWNVAQAIASADQHPVLPAANRGADRFRLLDSYIAFTLKSVDVSFGKQSLWLGPGEGGPFLFSDNAEPLWMLQINRASPWVIPGVVRVLGPLRWQFFLGQLSGHQFVFSAPALYGPRISPQPYIHGEKISFRPTANFEFGMGLTTVFGGPGMPFTWHNFLRTFSLRNQLAGTTGDGGDHRSTFDCSYRVPRLRRWLTIYLDSLVEDEASPIGSSRPSLQPGIYLPQIPRIRKLDLRLEGVYSDAPGQLPIGPMYYNARYRSGYTNYGNLMASWIGRQGRGGQGWATYWLSARNQIQLSFRHMEADCAFLEGGHLNDFGIRGEAMLRRDLALSSFLQYERWAFPLLADRPRSNLAFSVQLTFHPGVKQD